MNFPQAALENFQTSSGGQLSPFEYEVEEEQSPIFRTILTEVALAVVPGGDFIEIGRQFCGWLVRGTPVDKVAVALSALGLLMDAGYLTGPIGAAGNVVVGVLRALWKIVPQDLALAFIHMSDELLQVAITLGEYVLRIPTPPGMNILTSTATKAQILINQSMHIVHGGFNVVHAQIAGTFQFLATRVTKHFNDEAVEGVYAFRRYGAATPDLADDVLDDILQAMPSELADESFESVSQAMGRSLKEDLLPDGQFADRGLERVQNCTTTARRAAADMHPHLRDLVQQVVGEGLPFKTMQEFEACRFMRAADLQPEQVAAMKQISAAIAQASSGGPIRKVIPPGDFDNYINGRFNPQIRRSVAKVSDVDDLTGTPTATMIEELRLDFDGSPFTPDGGYAVIEADEVGALVGEVKMPKQPEFHNPGDRLVVQDYPYTGNGLIASTGGRLRPEYHLGDGMLDLPVGSTIKKYDADGTLVAQKVLGRNNMWVDP